MRQPLLILLLSMPLVAMVAEHADARFFRSRRCASVVEAPILTPALARDALLDMMQSPRGREFGWFEPEIVTAMSRMKIVEEADGWHSWSAYRVKPAERVYTLIIAPQPGARACLFEYKGAFELDNGRWTATLPELVSAALQPGK